MTVLPGRGRWPSTPAVCTTVRAVLWAATAMSVVGVGVVGVGVGGVGDGQRHQHGHQPLIRLHRRSVLRPGLHHETPVPAELPAVRRGSWHPELENPTVERGEVVFARL
jgi:hypothetical protein